jgi:hypothetical protein
VAVGAGHHVGADPPEVAHSHVHPEVGHLLAQGIESRRRWVVVPPWARLLLVLRGVIGPVFDLAARSRAAEFEGRFLEDVERRGTDASAPVGAGGEAAREREPNRT